MNNWILKLLMNLSEFLYFLRVRYVIEDFLTWYKLPEIYHNRKSEQNRISVRPQTLKLEINGTLAAKSKLHSFSFIIFFFNI